jgi:type II secretory ATPase GspE/PulE/Tfp pilus assembly ATPase PilB-like protein
MSPQTLVSALARLNPGGHDYALQFVDLLLPAAQASGASDVHLQPTADQLEIRWRIDGVLQPVGSFPRGKVADVVARLKVLCGLLTYRNDVPQEGRLREGNSDVEMRISTFPTLYGERAVIRLFSSPQQFLYPADLGLPAEIEQGLDRSLAETSGTIIISGPAGSGKTTTIYACLRHLVQAGLGKSIVTLEDPIEAALAGVAQSQVNPAAGFDLPLGLRSILRQDPEVIAVGEIRDRETAEIVFQAALTGHLVLTTFHAGSAATALGRLLDLGIEPYLLRSGIRALLCQRLVRRLCECAVPATTQDELLRLNVASARVARGCEACRQTGYRGRLVLAEALPPLEGELASALLARQDARALETLAREAGLVSIWQGAIDAVESGQTSPAEVRRVLGLG